MEAQTSPRHGKAGGPLGGTRRALVRGGLILAALFLSGAAPLSEERIVLRTSLGDIVLALYPEAAPRHAAQILRLVSLGVYDGTPFFKVNPDFFLQLGGVDRRRRPLNAEQAAAVTTLKAEFHSAPHRYGTVTMARDYGDPDSAQTSFLILTADVPPMDGKYTVVGEVTRGREVIEAIRAVPRDKDGHPIVPVEVERAWVVASERELAGAGLRALGAARSLPPGFSEGLLALFAMGALLLGVSRRHPRLRSPGLLLWLAAFFGAFALALPLGPQSSYAGGALLAVAFGFFLLMTRFES